MPLLVLRSLPAPLLLPSLQTLPPLLMSLDTSKDV